MTDYKATPEQWAQCEDWVKSSVVGASDACILELRARVETLEAAARKHIAETSSNILALASRVESLEAAERETSKIHQISKPLKLTPEQMKQVEDRLGLNLKSTPDSNQIVNYRLVERVEDVLIESIKDQGSMPDKETIQAAYEEFRAILAGGQNNREFYLSARVVCEFFDQLLCEQS